MAFFDQTFEGVEKKIEVNPDRTNDLQIFSLTLMRLALQCIARVDEHIRSPLFGQCGVERGKRCIPAELLPRCTNVNCLCIIITYTFPESVGKSARALTNFHRRAQKTFCPYPLLELAASRPLVPRPATLPPAREAWIELGATSPREGPTSRDS
jgi:hypothetical protein